jgi:hypothetical protein
MSDFLEVSREVGCATSAWNSTRPDLGIEAALRISTVASADCNPDSRNALRSLGGSILSISRPMGRFLALRTRYQSEESAEPAQTGRPENSSPLLRRLIGIIRVWTGCNSARDLATMLLLKSSEAV